MSLSARRWVVRAVQAVYIVVGGGALATIAYHLATGVYEGLWYGLVAGITAAAASCYISDTYRIIRHKWFGPRPGPPDLRVTNITHDGAVFDIEGTGAGKSYTIGRTSRKGGDL